MTNPQKDNLDIRHLNALYGDAVMRRDSKLWGSLWQPDGVWHFLGESIVGQANILARWEAAMAGFPVVFHTHHSGLIDIKDDEANCRWYIAEDILDSNGNALRIVGIYNDRCVRTPSGWRYSSRRFDPLYHGPGVIRTEHVMPYPADINSPHDA